VINKSLSQMNAERVIRRRAQRDAAQFNLKLKLKKRQAASLEKQLLKYEEKERHNTKQGKAGY